jgi:hypothetical protein
MLNSIFRAYIRLEYQASKSDYQHFKGLKRGVLRAFWDLKTENAEHIFDLSTRQASMNTTARER